MYAETRYYDNGSIQAKLHKGWSYPEIELSEGYDTYVESIGDSKVQADFDNSSDYKSIQEWLQEFDVEDYKQVIAELEKGNWVALTA